MKAAVRRSLERLMKRRIRHRDGSKISPKEARGLAKLAKLMHDAKAEREAALSAAIARHPAGSRLPSKDATRLADDAVHMHESTARQPGTDPEIVIVEQPPVIHLPADMDCMRCNENPAIDGRLWCTACVEIVDALDAEHSQDGAR